MSVEDRLRSGLAAEASAVSGAASLPATARRRAVQRRNRRRAVAGIVAVAAVGAGAFGLVRLLDDTRPVSVATDPGGGDEPVGDSAPAELAGTVVPVDATDLSWTESDLDEAEGGFDSLVAGNGRFYTVQPATSSVLQSDDGVTWTTVASAPDLGGAAGLAVGPDGTLYVPAWSTTEDAPPAIYTYPPDAGRGVLDRVELPAPAAAGSVRYVPQEVVISGDVVLVTGYGNLASDLDRLARETLDPETRAELEAAASSGMSVAGDHWELYGADGELVAEGSLADLGLTEKEQAAAGPGLSVLWRSVRGGPFEVVDVRPGEAGPLSWLQVSAGPDGFLGSAGTADESLQLRSSDGLRWEVVADGDAVYDLALAGDALVASAAPSGLARSVDGGSSWTALRLAVGDEVVVSASWLQGTPEGLVAAVGYLLPEAVARAVAEPVRVTVDGYVVQMGPEVVVTEAASGVEVARFDSLEPTSDALVLDLPDGPQLRLTSAAVQAAAEEQYGASMAELSPGHQVLLVSRDGGETWAASELPDVPEGYEALVSSLALLDHRVAIVLQPATTDGSGATVVEETATAEGAPASTVPVDGVTATTVAVSGGTSMPGAVVWVADLS